MAAKVMAVTNIPDDEHFVKYIKNREYYIHNGKVTPYPAAFHLRPASATHPADETLSGVHYEWFDGSPNDKLHASGHFIAMEMKRKDALIRLNSGAIKKQGVDCNRKLRVTCNPQQNCEPYAEIRGLPAVPDEKLCGLLASMALIEATEAVQILEL